MQELPELELYRALLAERFSGAAITALEFHEDLINEIATELQHDVFGKSVWFVERRAELIVFHLDNGKRLIFRLSDEASIYVGSSNETLERGASIYIRFDDRFLALHGVTAADIELTSVKELESIMKSRGIDPLDKRLSLAKFMERYAKKRSSIKTALVDQSLLAGIGPVYSDEILFEAGLRPDRKTAELSHEEWESLYSALNHIVRDSISHGGVRELPLFAGDGISGLYRERLAVHELEGQACKRCGGTIKKSSVAGRKCYSCPDCQK
ncbi:Fpg/Nei family DNA glycosylase [Paenibacillus sp. PAMC21692]|uniref:Fpg/Nei family DNA glycosylase n=1 Tax=Paenibacillus sp. PAMC21692 TaxID=2762320 RepID=UPI00164D28CA|nr:DNA-formamidopyrimidine glycosylase family protein [Paenibacillus sp. PAMC21692]QNK55230.1 Fpg/Nei family DNA glycosylase [Paenibacillus sp. PAMC21692]